MLIFVNTSSSGISIPSFFILATQAEQVYFRTPKVYIDLFKCDILAFTIKFVIPLLLERISTCEELIVFLSA